MLKKIVNNLLRTSDTAELHSLFKQPKKEHDMARFQVFKPNLVQQTDILFITNDHGYKYILVVVDDHSKKCDAEKLKNKDCTSVLKALKKIYDRDILKIPQQIEVDDGSEFKGIVKKWFNDNNVRVRVALPNRHRQQGIVERKNQVIGTLIHQIQTHKELQSGKINRQWIDVLPDIIKEINENLPKPLTAPISESPISNSYNKELYGIGHPVRIQLDHPIDTQGKKLHGKFRSTDMRWTREVFKITQVLLKQGSPPLYLTDKTNEVAYSKEQLQPAVYFV
jgi:hypothetical protein